MNMEYEIKEATRKTQCHLCDEPINKGDKYLKVKNANIHLDHIDRDWLKIIEDNLLKGVGFLGIASKGLGLSGMGGIG
jgi:hypothetical protein